jgi:uncharacterized membrane protein
MMTMSVVGEDRVSAYLDAVSDALRRVDPKARAEIIGELSNHIAESQAAGRSAHDVIDGLGDPADLAAMYERELRTTRPGRKHYSVDSFVRGFGRWLAHSRRLRELQIMAFLALPLLVIVGTIITAGVGVVVAFAEIADDSNNAAMGLLSIVFGFLTLVVGSVLIARVWRTMTRMIRRASEGKAIQLLVIPAWPLTPDERERLNR